jgi:hypothetical protein
MSSTLSLCKTQRILVNIRAMKDLVSNAHKPSSRCLFSPSGPSCRAPISADVIFIRAAFEPTDAELSGNTSASSGNVDSEDEMIGVSDMIIRGTKGKGRARRIHKRGAVYDSDYEDDDDDDDMSDFIVEDDEDEEEKDAKRDIKQRVKKRRAMVVESDDDLNADEKEVIIGRSPREVPASMGQVKTMSRFLPSTKMKVGCHVSVRNTYELVSLANDGASREVHP